jgi:hypothetical protein
MINELCDLYQDNIIYREFKPFFDLGKTVIDFANQSIDDLKQWKVDESLESHLRDVVSRMYFSSLKTFLSILFLCNKGHGEDAMSLTRTIFDNYLTFRYIQKDPKDRIYKFMNYLVLENKFKLDKAKQPNDKMLQEVKKLYFYRETEILDKYNLIKALYIKPGEDENTALKEFKFGRWAGFNKRQMAQETGLETDYDYVFHYHSFFVHPHPYGLSGFREETESEVRFGAKPSEKEVFPALPMATRYLLLVFKEWSDLFELDRKTEIDTFLSKVSKLENEYIKKMESCYD